MKNILITPRSLTRNGHAELDRLRQLGYHLVFCDPEQLPDENTLIHLLEGCCGYLAGVEPITRRVLTAAVDLRCISRHGSGTDNIDLTAAEERGISVRSSNGANARSVAELTLGLILALTRSIVRADRELKSQHWERHAGFELAGKTLGIIGHGQVGRTLGQLVTPLEIKTMAHDPAQGMDCLAELLYHADIISLHCPPGNTPLVDEPFLRQCKPGLFLVNAARGELLDDDAVLKALDDGRLAGLAMDAWRHEPPGKDPLALHPRVIATPHIGGYTRESVDRTVKRAVDQLLECLS